MNNTVELGYITKAFGLQGAVIIELFNADSTVLQAGVSLMVKPRSGSVITLQVSSACGQRVFFTGITDRNMADSLRGATVAILRSDLPATDPDEFYLEDLIGASVHDTKNCLLGQVEAISSNNAQDLIELKTTTGLLAYVPLVAPILVDIDIENGLLVIDPPEGLLELAGA